MTGLPVWGDCSHFGLSLEESTEAQEFLPISRQRETPTYLDVRGVRFVCASPFPASFGVAIDLAFIAGFWGQWIVVHLTAGRRLWASSAHAHSRNTMPSAERSTKAVSIRISSLVPSFLVPSLLDAQLPGTQLPGCPVSWMSSFLVPSLLDAQPPGRTLSLLNTQPPGRPAS